MTFLCPQRLIFNGHMAQFNLMRWEFLSRRSLLAFQRVAKKNDLFLNIVFANMTSGMNEPFCFYEGSHLKIKSKFGDTAWNENGKATSTWWLIQSPCCTLSHFGKGCLWLITESTLNVIYVNCDYNTCLNFHLSLTLIRVAQMIHARKFFGLKGQIYLE